MSLSIQKELTAPFQPVAKSDNKVVFADQLRALAFICVVIVHWLGIYNFQPDFISMVTGASPLPADPGILYNSIVPPLPNFNFGPFGVSIFFLISGFVIPFTMKKKSKLGFILSRTIRIYPTYIICSFIMLAFYIASHLYWGTNSQITVAQFFSNVTLTSSILNYPSIDFINWTLSIEIKFYLACLLIYSAINKGNPAYLILLCMAILAVTFFTKAYKSSVSPGVFSLDGLKIEMMYVIYMMLGVLFNFLYLNKVRFLSFSFYSIIVSTAFILTWITGVQANQFPMVAINYLYGYVLFSTFFFLRRMFKELSYIGFLSKISYSFYALHSVIGYCSIRIVHALSGSYIAGITCAVVVVTLLSYYVNVHIEERSISISKKFR